MAALKVALKVALKAALVRWLPGSLFGRLMGVLAIGLLLAQGLSALINVAERDRLVAGGFGLQPAQRIADVVKLLDALADAERAQVVAVLRVPPLVLSLQAAPLLPEADAAGWRGAMFSARLRAALGDDRAVRTQAREGFGPLPAMAGSGAHRPGQRGGGPGMMERGPGDGVRSGMHPGMQPGMRPEMRPEMRSGMRAASGLPVLRTEVQLRDGRWARFDTELPAAPQALPWRLVLTLAVLLLSMLALSYVAVRWVVRPLRVLADAADALGTDLDRAPLPEDGPREVRQAARAFNTMQRRLAGFVNERIRVLTALSHDLKTPLTRLRLRAELMDDDEQRQRFEADLKEMEAMVVQTLEFMRGLDGHEPRAPVDVGMLLDALRADNAAMGRSLRIDGSAAAPYVGVASLLKRALANLIDNAFAYGISATVRIDDDPRQLVLRVQDEGSGIPEAQLEQVFEPFFRLEASRNRATGGTGLGLGIARNIARSHGGDLVLRNRPTGGLEAVLSLPRPGGDGTHPGAGRRA